MIVKGPWRINEAALSLNLGLVVVAAIAGIGLAEALGLDDWPGFLVALLPGLCCTGPIVFVLSSAFGFSFAKRKVYRVASED